MPNKREQGWVQYGRQPFVEDLERIARRIGSTLYEVMEEAGVVYIRRVD